MRSTPTIRWRAASPRRRSPIFSSSSARFNDKGVLHKQIAVEDVRRTVPFFGSTAGEGGWRVAIVDAVDELNRAGANALLKVLEEPPRARAAAAGQPFRGARAADAPLALPHRHAAAACRCRRRARGRCRDRRDAGRSAIVAAAAAAEGSVARALALLDEGALALRQQALDLLDRLPALDPKALHALGEALAGTDPQPLAAFVDTVNVWLSQRLRRRQRTISAGSTGWPRPGSRSTPPRATPKPTISSASRWFSTCSACLPRPRAVDTNPATVDQRNAWKALLHHHRDRLSERRAAYRPRL